MEAAGIEPASHSVSPGIVFVAFEVVKPLA